MHKAPSVTMKLSTTARSYSLAVSAGAASEAFDALTRQMTPAMAKMPANKPAYFVAAGVAGVISPPIMLPKGDDRCI